MTGGFKVILRGVRGTVPTAGPDTVKYGGNTSCVEVRCGDSLIILDAGTGIISLGNEDGIRDVDILLSHTHLDHIQGFPFFRPLYDKNCNIRVWGAHRDRTGVREILEKIMSPPVFPVPLEELMSEQEFVDFKAGETLKAANFEEEGIDIKTMGLSHPDDASAYRIEYKGKSLCYVTDVEHEEGKTDEDLARFISNTDLFIYDSTFTDENFSDYKGWGHSTWQEGIRLAEKAGVKKSILFHHDPQADDKEMDRRAGELSKTGKNAVFAREGMCFEL